MSIIRQLVEEDRFESVSAAIRTPLPSLKNEDYELDDETAERIAELNTVYDSVSSGNERVTEFFFDLTWMLDEFDELASKKGFPKLESWIDNYSEHYFQTLDVMDYRSLDQDARFAFVNDTVDLALEFLEVEDYLSSLGYEAESAPHGFIEEYFEESHVPDQPYLKFKL